MSIHSSIPAFPHALPVPDVFKYWISLQLGNLLPCFLYLFLKLKPSVRIGVNRVLLEQILQFFAPDFDRSSLTTRPTLLTPEFINLSFRFFDLLPQGKLLGGIRRHGFLLLKECQFLPPDHQCAILGARVRMSRWRSLFSALDWLGVARHEKKIESPTFETGSPNLPLAGTGLAAEGGILIQMQPLPVGAPARCPKDQISARSHTPSSAMTYEAL
jgi:hypothetical protein